MTYDLEVICAECGDVVRVEAGTRYGQIEDIEILHDPCECPKDFESLLVQVEGMVYCRDVTDAEDEEEEENYWEEVE
jgi:hypothetical protein